MLKNERKSWFLTISPHVQIVGRLGLHICGNKGLNILGHKAHFEGVGREGGAKVALQRRQVRALQPIHVKHVHKRGKEKLQLHFGQRVAEAHAGAGAERQKVLRFDNFDGVVLLLAAGGGLQETLGAELFRLLPQLGVHVDGVQVGHDMAVGRDQVTVNDNRSVIRKRR